MSLSSSGLFASFVGTIRSSRAAIGKREKRVELRLRRAVATIERLEARQMLSADPFSTKGTPVTTVGTAFATTLADVNGDGIPDLIAAYGNGRIAIFTGNADTPGFRGTGQFTYARGLIDGLGTATGTTETLKVATLYNGHPDIIVGAGTKISVLIGLGDGTFPTTKTETLASGTVQSIAVGDVNKDGLPDIVVGDSVGNISVFLGNNSSLPGGTGGQPYSVGASTDSISGIAIADVTGDGNPDLIFLDKTAGTVSVLANPDTPTSSGAASLAPFGGGQVKLATSTTADNTNVIAFAVGHLGTKNYSTELVTIEASSSGHNQVAVLYNKTGGANAFTYNASVPVVSLTSTDVPNQIGLHLGDVNGDGFSDPIVTQYYVNKTAVITTFGSYSNGLTGAPFVTPVAVQGNYYFDGGLAIGDINGDGLSDVVLSYQDNSSVKNELISSLNNQDLAPTITSADTTTFLKGTTGTFVIKTTGSIINTPMTISTSDTLPAGLTLTDEGDGVAVLSGTPTGSGATAITLTASNSVSDFQQVLTIDVNTPPSFTNAATATFTVGTLATPFTITANNGFPATPVTITQSGFPLKLADNTTSSGLTFTDNGDGTATISGTPVTGTAGTYTVTLTANNGVTPNGMQTFTLNIDGPPVFTSAATDTFVVGTAGTFNISAKGFPTTGETITESGAALPTGLTFQDNGDGTGVLSGTPASGTGKVYTLTFTAHNSSTPDATQNLILTVNASPAFTSATSTTFALGVAKTFNITTAGGFSTTPETITLTSGTLPLGLTLKDNGNGSATISGTPLPASAGVYTLQLTAHNGVGADVTQTLKIAVTTPSASFAVGVNNTFTVVTPGFPAATITHSALPGTLSFHDNGDGTATISGVPTANLAGVYLITLSFKVNNVPTTQKLQLTISNLTAPKFTSASKATLQLNTNDSFTVKSTGFPPPAFTEFGALPTGVSFIDNGDGTATIKNVPDVGGVGVPNTVTGIFPFAIRARNLSGVDALQVFTLEIDQAVAITSANTATFTAGTPASFAVISTGFPAGSLTVSGKLPGGVSLQDNHNGTATLLGTPSANSGGSYPLTFTANNGKTKTTQTFTLTVDQNPSISGATINSVFKLKIGSSVNKKFAISGFPAPFAVTSITNLPTGLSLIVSGTQLILSGSPNTGTAGIYGVTFKLSNHAGGFSILGFTIVVS